MNICTFIRTALTVLAATSLLNANGQTETPKFTDPPQVIPPSPVASSLLRDVNVPVNAYSGAISFSLPLHTVKCGSLSLPITLTYSSHGVPVEADAGPVGLDWQLEAGGVIGRSVVGLPDEMDVNSNSTLGGRGYNTTAKKLGMPLSNYKDDYPFQTWLQKITTGKDAFYQFLCFSKPDLLACIGNPLEYQELTPDNYFLNFNGMSARLFFDHAGNYFFSPYKAWKLNGSPDVGFTIIVEDGTEYQFYAVEKTLASNMPCAETGCDFTTCDSYCFFSGEEMNTSWHLSKIISSNKSDTIYLDYQKVNYSVSSKVGEQSRSLAYAYESIDDSKGIITPLAPQYRNKTSSLQEIKGNFLQTIRTNKERVTFYSSGREDVGLKLGGFPSHVGLPVKIDSLRITHLQPGKPDQYAKSYILGYKYFSSPSGGIGNTYFNKRLCLNFATEKFGNNFHQTHWFDYYDDIPLPPKNSLAQDHWGYYNGKVTNKTMVPTIDRSMKGMFKADICIYDIGDRSVDTSFASMGMLKKITYPTGGHSSFQYEQNTFTSHYGDLNYIPDIFRREYSTATSTTSDMQNPQSVSFTIDEEQTVEIDFWFTCFSESDDGGKWPGISWFSLTNQEGEKIDLTPIQIRDKSEITLPPGKYTLTAQTFDNNYEASIYCNFYHLPEKPNILFAGGARVKQVEHSNGADLKPLVKQYIYDLDENKSSGTLLTAPYFHEDQHLPRYFTAGIADPAMIPIKAQDIKFYRIQSSSNIALGRTQGNLVGYTRVKILYGNAGSSGWEINDYSFFPDQYHANSPYAPNSSFEDLRGLPVMKKVYDKNGKLLAKTDNSYNFNNTPGDPNFRWINGLKVGALRYSEMDCNPMFWEFRHNIFRNYQFWPTLASTTNVQYLPNGRDSLVTKDVFAYNTVNGLVSSKKSVTSRGDTLLNVYKYPLDFKGTAVYDSMVARNIVSPVVQQLSYRGSSFLERATTHYGFQNANMILPTKINLQTGTAADEERLTFNSYDRWGNPEEFQKSDRVKTTYLWGYNGAYPVAQIVGAGKAAVSDAMARAGITQANLDNAAKYSDAEFIELLKKLRLQLPSAQTSTFTYKPLVGMTSATDPRGETTYYSYDKFGRLLNVKNKYQLVLNELRYHYFNEPEQ